MYVPHRDMGTYEQVSGYAAQISSAIEEIKRQVIEEDEIDAQHVIDLLYLAFEGSANLYYAYQYAMRWRQYPVPELSYFDLAPSEEAKFDNDIKELLDGGGQDQERPGEDPHHHQGDL